MAVYDFEVFVVEHNAMKRPKDAPDQLWGGPWFTPEVMRVEVEADCISEARWLAAGIGHANPLFTDPYVVDVVGPI